MKSKYTTIPVFIRYFKNNNNDDKIFSSADNTLAFLGREKECPTQGNHLYLRAT